MPHGGRFPGRGGRGVVGLSLYARSMLPPQEPLAADDGREPGKEDFEGDLAVVTEVVGEGDRGHAAAAELPLEAVADGEGGLQ